MIFHKREELDVPFSHILIANSIGEHGLLSSKTTNYIAPLYLNDENVGIVYRRTSKDPVLQTPVLHTNTIVSDGYFRGPGNQIDTISPLFILQNGSHKRANFDTSKLQELFSDVEQPDEKSREVYPEDIIDYTYATLHNPSYRKKFREFLRTDFPRVPRPTTWSEFWRLVELGCKLRKLHTMSSNISTRTTFSEVGNNTINKIEFNDNKVYINSAQYFGNVSGTAWNFYIGGYQPAQKWLKDRKGRKLSTDDIIHYQKIITILDDTDLIMKEIG